MMHIISKFALLVVLSLLFSFQAHARETITTDVYFNRAGTKILSGVANVATGWMELPKNISLWNQRDQKALIGITEGLVGGVFHTVGRTGNGALDLVTFWLPTYPIPDPLFVWDDFSKESEYHGWRMGR